MDTKEKIFEIPAPNLAKFQEKWAKLVRRANKLNIIPPSYLIIKEESRPHTVKREVFNDLKNKVEYIEENVVMIYHLIQIQHPQVKVPGGWEFVASLEHTEEGNITHNISRKDLPAKYRDCGPCCDHCQSQRNRKDTFVVMDEQSNYKQVGRNCLAEFLGVDGTMYANMAEIYYIAGELAEASEGGDSWGSSGPWFDYLEVFLANVAEVISIKGWMSRKTARDLEAETGSYTPSTSDIAFTHMHPQSYHRREDRLYDDPSAKSEELAKEAIAWCENLPDVEVDASEYLHNIRIIARRGIVGAKQYGYAASIISAFQRTLIDQINKEKKAKEQVISQHVGTIGKRQNFLVIVEHVSHLESDYGVSHLHIMKDEKGNSIKWFSTSKVLDTGTPILIKATPKKHDEFRGVKETIVTRCVMVKSN